MRGFASICHKILVVTLQLVEKRCEAEAQIRAGSSRDLTGAIPLLQVTQVVGQVITGALPVNHALAPFRTVTRSEWL